MILKTTSYQVGDQFYPTLEKAQEAEIAAILTSVGSSAAGFGCDTAAEVIVANAERVIDILSTNAKSRPRARKINGSTRKPRSKPSTGAASLTPEQTKAAGLI